MGKRISQFKGLFNLSYQVKWNQSNFYGKTPWIMFGTNPHISIHPSSDYLFQLMAKMQEKDDIPEYYLISTMEFDEVHVTISGKHNYFTPEGVRKAASSANDPSDNGTMEQATNFLRLHMFAVEANANNPWKGGIEETTKIDLGPGTKWF